MAGVAVDDDGGHGVVGVVHGEGAEVVAADASEAVYFGGLRDKGSYGSVHVGGLEAE